MLPYHDYFFLRVRNMFCILTPEKILQKIFSIFSPFCSLVSGLWLPSLKKSESFFSALISYSKKIGPNSYFQSVYSYDEIQHPSHTYTHTYTISLDLFFCIRFIFRVLVRMLCVHCMCFCFLTLEELKKT